MQQLVPVIGVVRKPHPSHLKNEYLQFALDVDFQRYTIAPMRTDRKYSAFTGKTIYLSDCCFKTSQQCVNIAVDPTGCKRVFASNYETLDYPITATPSDFCDNVVTRMGWPCEFVAPVVMYAATTQSDRTAEPRSYVYTFTNKFGEESQPSLPSPSVTVDFSVEATVSGFDVPAAEYGASYVNIYMLVAGMSNEAGSGVAGNDEYLRVAVIEPATLMFTHAPLVHPFDQALSTDDFTPVPQDATDICWFGTSQVVFQSEGRVRFTEPHNYSAAPMKYTYETRSKLLKIAATNDYIYLLTCSHPETLDTKQDGAMSGNRAAGIVGDKYPLIGLQSVAIWEKSVLFASTTGIVMMTGASASVITSDTICTQGQWDSIAPHQLRGVCFDGYYYGSTDMAAFRIELPGGGKAGAAEKFSFLSIRPTAWLVTEDNRLMYADATGTWEFGQGDDYKEYTAVTRDICEAGGSIHSTIRLRSDPEGGPITMTQTVLGDRGILKETTRTVPTGGVYKWPRSLGTCVNYTFKGKSEVSAVVVGNSVLQVTDKA